MSPSRKPKRTAGEKRKAGTGRKRSRQQPPRTAPAGDQPPRGQQADPPTIVELQARIDKKFGSKRWQAGESAVWKRHLHSPKHSRMAGVLEDKPHRQAVLALLEAQRAVAKLGSKGLRWDGAHALRVRPPIWKEKFVAQGLVGAAGDQGDCKACVAFALVATLEARLLVKDAARHTGLDLSEALLFNCGGGSCATGWDVTAAIEKAFNLGLADETQYPAVPLGTACPTGIATMPLIKGLDFPDPKSDATKATIRSDGPVIAVMRVFEDFVAYKSGVYRRASDVDKGLHAVTVYDHDHESWHCINSWGADWGVQGKFQIAFGECEIDDYVFHAPIV